MARAMSKRAVQRNESAKVNRVALIVGGCIAGASLVMVVVSFLSN